MHDAGSDAADLFDGGGAADAGEPFDGGGAADAGLKADAGEPFDGGGAVDAGLNTDAGGPFDAGTADAGTPDAGGASDAGAADAGRLALEVTYTDSEHEILCADASGTVYAVSRSAGTQNLLASSDGARTFVARGVAPHGGEFFNLTVLGDGTLLADVRVGASHAIARSTDAGATWSEVLPLGDYRTLTPHSFAQLGTMIYLLEYQVFTGADTPIGLHVSSDAGLTWTLRYTFQGHRHGHGLRADPARGVLWAWFGDTTPQCGVYRSADGGFTWRLVLGGQEGDVVDGEVLPDGSVLFGQDISYLPPMAAVATVDATGTYAHLVDLTGPAYSTHAIRSGGFVIGAARESNGDLYAAGEVSAHVFGSADGVNWEDLLSYPRASDVDDVRADVYWELPSGELVLELRNARGFGAFNSGFQLLRAYRH